MALYRTGDSGEAVRDIQERLTLLGFPIGDDPEGEFGDGTHAAVEAFQRARSLTPDGLVGRETWRTMVDAGFRLGDRLLYNRFPMLHGDDVATLQHDLNALGFDAGIVDGIFGADTLRAVLDFQQNRGMAEDGIAGPEVIEELALMTRATQKMGREVVRERVWLRALPPSVAGQRIFVDPFCRDDLEAGVAWEAGSAAAAALREMGALPTLSRAIDTRPAERSRARQANAAGAEMVVGFALPRTDCPGVFYFASPLSRSESGEALAAAIAARLGLEAIGRVSPMLRETRATAVVVTVPTLDATLGAAVARGIQAWLRSRAEQDGG
ncbi:MAG: peptidoglycan-binding protein [Actinobacteria bacterium]|nr:peptidoglycan-binding protein [Actinomycetota bacterium]